MKKKYKIILDVLMLLLTLTLFSKQLISMNYHEVAGLLLIGIIVLHICVNIKTVVAMSKKFIKVPLHIKCGCDGGYVKISASKNGNSTEIIVKDNGIGIDREHIDKIWGRFYRIDDVRNDEYGSCGLGLAMVKSTINLHGGKISVTSELGQGSEFRIEL